MKVVQHDLFLINQVKKIAIFCSKHKKDGMVDVHNKTCQHEGCTTQPVLINQVKKLLYFVANIKKMEWLM